MSGAFDYGLPNNAHLVGEVVQSPLNLEALTNGDWVALDGHDCVRSDYPEISSYFPAGAFTSTARTLNASPATAAVVTDGTNFLVPGAVGSSPLQASADGISWSTSATWTAGTSPASLVVAGSRYVMAGSGGDLTVPYVSNTGQTAVNQVAKTNWTATTVAGTTALAQGLAYGPTANAGAGRTVLVPDGAGTTIWSLDDGATAWAARSHTTSRSKISIVYTGAKFVVFVTAAYENKILTSADGATWAEQSLPFQFVNSGATSATDGRGTVVTWGSVETVSTSQVGKCFIVSRDHGATWRVVPVPATMQDVIAVVSYINGMFFAAANQGVTGNGPMFISPDGVSWTEARPQIAGPEVSTCYPRTGTYKAGVYLFLNSASTAAFTSTEDKSLLTLPRAFGAFFTAAGATHALGSVPVYMKARSG